MNTPAAGGEGNSGSAFDEGAFESQLSLSRLSFKRRGVYDVVRFSAQTGPIHGGQGGGYSQYVARLIADEAVRLYRRDNSPADAIKKAMSKASKLYKKA